MLFNETLAGADARLAAWAFESRDRGEPLELPTTSGIKRMIDHARIRQRVRKAPRQLTAQGTQTVSFVRPKLQCDDAIDEIDKIVAALPAWAKRVLFMHYLHGQPARFAARIMRMPTGDYLQYLRAAVARVDAALDPQIQSPF